MTDGQLSLRVWYVAWLPMVLIILLCLAAVTLLGLVVGAVLDSVVVGVLAAVVALTSLLVMAWKHAGRKQRELERGRPCHHDATEDGSS